MAVLTDGKTDGTFNLMVESAGGLPAKQIVLKAIELLGEKLKEIQVSVGGSSE